MFRSNLRKRPGRPPGDPDGLSTRRPYHRRTGLRRLTGSLLALALAGGLALTAVPAHAAGAQSGPTLLVLSNSDDSVSVVDAVTNAVRTTIPLGQSYGAAMTATPSGDRAYVANADSNNVSVVNGVTNSVVTTIPVGKGPNTLALTPDGSQLWVANYSDNTVSVVDTSTNTVVFTFPVPGAPEAIAFSSDGLHAYFGLYSSGQLGTVSTSDVADARAHGYSIPVKTVATGANPNSVVVSPDGSTVYVNNLTSGTVSVVNTATNTIRSTVTGLPASTFLLAVNGGAQLLLGSRGGNTVFQITTATNVVRNLGSFAGPTGMAASSDGKAAYVANTSGTVSVVDVPAYTVSKSIPGVGASPVALVYRPGGSGGPTAPTAATLALGASPAGSSTQGDLVTLKATVTPSSATGAVTFYDGAKALGPAQTVSAGSASLSTSTLTAGQHSLTAQFVPDTAGYTSATSPTIPYVVNVPGAVATTTALAVSPSDTAPEHAPVALTATVAPAGAVGTVQFVDTRSGSATPIGDPVAVGADGSASYTTTTLASGMHTLTAVFTPNSTAAYNISASAGVAYQVTALATGTTGENITTTVLPGALVISVANSQVVLPSPVLNPAGDLMATSGNLNPITLTDSRAGNLGWTVTCQVGDFADAATDRINGQNLGFTPKVIDLSPAQTATAGTTVPPAAVEANDSGQAGLKTPRTLVTGQGLGTAHFGGALNLNVPTDTVPGTYTTTMTITAI